MKVKVLAELRIQNRLCQNEPLTRQRENQKRLLDELQSDDTDWQGLVETFHKLEPYSQDPQDGRKGRRTGRPK